MIYAELFWTFLKIGAFTFGGGYAMLPLIQQAVASHGWMTTEELINFVAVSESTPGPFAINTATYVGSVTGGIPGAFCATLGVVLPSFVIILLVARAYKAFRSNRIVEGCMEGLKPAVVGLIGAAVVTTGQTVFFGKYDLWQAFRAPAFWISVCIFALAIVLIRRKVHPIAVILLSAVIGIACEYLIL